MTPGARLAAAIEILTELETGIKPVDVIIGAYFRSRRYAGSKDRRWVTSLLYELVRKQARIDWWLNRLAPDQKPGPRLRLLADVALDPTTDSETLEKMFSGARHCPEPLSDAEKQLAAGLAGQPLSHPDQPAWVANEFPDWLEKPLMALWGDDLSRQVAALNKPAKLDLRVNRLKADRNQVLSALAGEGLTAEPMPYSPDGIRVEGRPRLSGLDIFRDGLIEVQDEGSQLAAQLTGAEPGHRVIDYCAGAGGKSLALAADMNVGGRAKGWITACDIAFKRLKKLDDRAKRAGVRNIRTRVLKSDQDPWIADSAQSADRVLVDAPCTGVGAWRRNADAKWRMTPDFVADMLGRQEKVLNNAAKLVKLGGRLIYVTCSPLPEENEHQVDRFLDGNQAFNRMDIRDIWVDRIGSTPCPTDQADLRLTPADHGTDGFYITVLQRGS